MKNLIVPNSSFLAVFSIVFFLIISAQADSNPISAGSVDPQVEQINSILGKIKLSDYLRELAIITGELPMPAKTVGSGDGGKRLPDRFALDNVALGQRYIIGRMQEMGFDVFLEQADMSGLSKPRPTGGFNIIAELKGTKNRNEVVSLTAHYDTTGNGHPGANDNGTGVAAVLEIARKVKEANFQPDHTLRFVFFDAEEIGLLTGSRTHANNVDHRGENVRLLVNLDMIGDNPAGTKNVLYDPGPFANELAPFMNDVNKRYSLDFGLGTWGVYGSDQRAFTEWGMAGISIFEHPHFEPGVEMGDRYYHPYNHSSEDKIANMNFKYATEVTRFVAGVVLDATRASSAWQTPERRPVVLNGKLMRFLRPRLLKGGSVAVKRDWRPAQLVVPRSQRCRALFN